MGIQYKAVAGVGLMATDLAKDHDEWEEKYGDEWETLQLISPYYDARFEDCYAGVVVYEVEYGAMELSMVSAQQALYRAMDKFRSLTGKSGKVFLSTYGY